MPFDSTCAHAAHLLETRQGRRVASGELERLAIPEQHIGRNALFHGRIAPPGEQALVAVALILVELAQEHVEGGALALVNVLACRPRSHCPLCHAGLEKERPIGAALALEKGGLTPQQHAGGQVTAHRLVVEEACLHLERNGQEFDFTHQ